MKQPLNRHDRQTIPGPHFRTHMPKVELEVIRGQARNKLRRLTDATFLFGSGKGCDLVLGDPQFSDVHGYILVTPEGVSIRHLGLEPVLTVGGVPITSAVLKHNDRIRTGPFEFRAHVRWAKAKGAMHMPREVVSSMSIKRIDAATQQVAELLNDIEQEMSIEQRLRLFVGSNEGRSRDVPQTRPLDEPTPTWPHLSQQLSHQPESPRAGR